MARVVVPLSSAAGRRFGLPAPSWRSITIGLGVLLLGGLALGLGWFWYSGYQSRALTAYAEAMARVQDSQAAEGSADGQAAAMRALEATLAEYPSSAAAPQAAYQLGNLRYAARQFAAARGAFEVALAKGATGTLESLSRAGIGYTWEADGDLAKAQQAYQTALSSVGPDSFIYEELMMALARVQERSGQKDTAVGTYQKILKDSPHTPRADVIKVRLAALGAGAP